MEHSRADEIVKLLNIQEVKLDSNLFLPKGTED